ncbi:MAG: large conductance mechanosensitive channel protein MscL [Bacteroidota bacterium]|jgi:large conductance mechanosensitive channel
MWKEFKEFALRGNVIDLAVGVIIGGAFGKIVTALVNDIIMPIIGLFLGGLNLSSLAIQVGNAVIKWGDFLQAVIDFLIIAIIVFLMVRGMNRLARKEPEKKAGPTTKDCPRCFTSIPLKATRCPNCTSELA